MIQIIVTHLTHMFARAYKQIAQSHKIEVGNTILIH